MRFRSSLMLALVLLMPPGAADAATLLFSNGPVTDTSSTGFCDSGPGVCGGSGTWTYFDNFVLASDATVTGFDYTDFFFTGSQANYVQTNWSIWSSDPLLGGSPVASGSSVATVSPLALPGSPFLFTVSGLNVSLTGGTQYWLGTNNLMNGAFTTTVAGSAGILAGSSQSDGAGVFNVNPGERAFSVYGDAATVPEPATLLLLGAGLGAAATRRRLKARR